jgi:predicted methyltransferase
MDRIKYEILRKAFTSKMTLWEAINIQDGNIKYAIEILKQLTDEGFVTAEQDRIVLTEKGMKHLSEMGIEGFSDSKCDSCDATGYVIGERFKWALETFKKVFSDRPLETAEFDQGVVPPENSIRRAEFVYERGDLERKKILFLGDDDLTSIAMALTEMPDEVHVIEIDKRIVDYINKTSLEIGLPVTAHIYNAVNPLPEEFKGKFDTFLTDPVETVKGTRVFISRCLSALKGNASSGYFGLSHYESSLKKWIDIERDLMSMNLVVTDVLRDFNKYLLVGERIIEEGFRVVKESPVKPNPPDYPWYRSTFFRVEVVGNPNPLVTGTIEWNREIYFDEDTYVALP